jgi:hypothetical protein
MALTGHLSDLSLSELIEFFCNQRKTGRLKVLYPQGPGCFYLQTGSVVDARIGVLRGIDAVYYALTLPNAKFEFSGSSEASERTINQPWTQVVLEGLRRLDEGVVPPSAFPPEYVKDDREPELMLPEPFYEELKSLRVPTFLSFMSKESMSKRKFLVVGAVAIAVVLSVAAIGVPAGWYHRAKAPAVASESATSAPSTLSSTAVVPDLTKSEPSEASTQPSGAVASLAAKQQREKERAKAREERAAITTPSATVPSSTTPAAVASESTKSGPKKVAVTVTYDESGRVTQASGGDATALRIARQKRFPAGKAGSATITIPIN